MSQGVLILTQDHTAIYTAKNVRLDEYSDSPTYDLYADIESNGVKGCLRVAQYKRRKRAIEMLERIAEKTRVHDGEVIDLAYNPPYSS